MARQQHKIDVQAVLDRMAIAIGAKTMVQLAEAMGLEANALSQSKYRNSIALHLLLNCVERSGTSLDYLVYGKGCVGRDESTSSDFVEIKPLIAGGLQIVQFDKKWLNVLHKGKSIERLRTLQLDDKQYIIDTEDSLVVSGIYALGDPVVPAIRECKRLLDGKIKIEDEEIPMSTDDLRNIGVVGRVIWMGVVA